MFSITRVFASPISWMSDRSVEIASQRRANYAAVAASLVAIWRRDGGTEKDALFAELAKLCMESNPDLYVVIETFADAVITGDAQAARRLAELLEQMRATAVLGKVRHNYVNKGHAREALFQKLIES